MDILDATKRAFRDELAKIANVRSGAIPFSPDTLAKKVQYTGAVRKTVRPRDFMREVPTVKTSSAGQAIRFGAGVATGTAGALGAVKLRKKMDDERLKRMQGQR